MKKKQALWICIVISVIAMTAEFIVSSYTNSLMLFSDGIHMLSHTLALGVTLLGILLAEQKGNKKPEYIAAMVNAAGLLVFSIYIMMDGIWFIMHPLQIELTHTTITATGGLIVNIITALLLFKGGIEDVNTKGAYLHMLSDLFSSAAILVGCAFIYYTGSFTIDGMLSVFISLVILKWAVNLFHESYRGLQIEKYRALR